VPSVPLLDSHGVGVELLVQHVQAGNGLDDHRVHLVGRELELVARQRMRQTEACAVDLRGDQVGDEGGHVLADGAVDLLGGGVGDGLEGEAGQVADGGAELGVGDGEGGLGLVLELVEQIGEHGRDLAIGEGGGLVERGDGILEFLGEGSCQRGRASFTADEFLTANFFSFNALTVPSADAMSSPRVSLFSSFLSLALKSA
jgi:hypothetical protein